MQQTSHLTHIFRIARIVLHTLLGLAIAALAWPIISKTSKLRLSKWWCKGLLGCFNIKVHTFGRLPNEATASTMFVANHISWADIHALNSVIPLRFIAKSEMSTWPIFGYLVHKSGTLFIDRSRRKDAVRIIEMTTKSLQRGENVGFFPEGTTTEGASILPFKSSIVQAAINAEAHIWPIAIRYPLPNGGANTQMAYAGDTTMRESIFNVLKQKKPVVELHFITPLPALEADRHALSKAVFVAISNKLNL